MTKTELIARQAKKIAELERARKRVKKALRDASRRFVSIGGPLNGDRNAFKLPKDIKLRQLKQQEMMLEAVRENEKKRLCWAQEVYVIIAEAEAILRGK